MVASLSEWRRLRSSSSWRLLVAANLSDVQESARHRLVSSIISALLVLAVAAGFITPATRRYVTRPLAELSRRVSRFSASDVEGGRTVFPNGRWPRWLQTPGLRNQPLGKTRQREP
jgi:hypothetical protein